MVKGKTTDWVSDSEATNIIHNEQIQWKSLTKQWTKSIDFFFIFRRSVGSSMSHVFLIFFRTKYNESVFRNAMHANAIEFHFRVIYLESNYVMFFWFKFMYEQKMLTEAFSISVNFNETEILYFFLRFHYYCCIYFLLEMYVLIHRLDKNQFVHFDQIAF